MELNIINKFHAKEEKCLEKLIVNLILAWSLLCDCCAKLIEYIKDIILSDHFITLHKQKPSDFTRQRKLPFQTLIFFMINLISGSYQKELDSFFKNLMGYDVPKRFVSKVALSKARLKLKYEAFVELILLILRSYPLKCSSISFRFVSTNLTRILWPGKLSAVTRIKKPSTFHIG